MQTAYSYDIELGVEGQRIETPFTSNIITGIAEAGIIPVGKVVIFDTTAGRHDKSVRVPSATGDITGPAAAGVSMWDPSYPFDGSGFKQFDTLPVMRKGRILLKCETVIAKAVRPFVRFAAGGNGVGSIRNDDDSGKAVAAPWLLTITPATVAGGLVVVEVNL